MLNVGNIEAQSAILNNEAIVQHGDVILYKSPDIPVPSERTNEKKLRFNTNDSGLVGDTAQIGMVASSGGVEGNIIFRSQNGGTIPGSTLAETMRVKGPNVGIQTNDPQCSLHVNGQTNTKQLSVGPSPIVANGNMTAHFRAPGAALTDGGQIFIEAGRDSSGGRAGWGSINVNGYFTSGTNIAVNYDKMIWRMLTDQRTTTDTFSIDSANMGSGGGYSRNWLKCEGNTAGMILNELVYIDNRPLDTSYYFRPVTHDQTNLGASTVKWKNGYFEEDVYARSGVNSSDRNLKKEIRSLGEDRGLSFVNMLKPVEYKFKNNNSNRIHYGFIAQEVEETMTELGDTDGTHNAIVVKDENDKYALRYTEMIAPLVKAIQELTAQNAALVARVEALENA